MYPPDRLADHCATDSAEYSAPYTLVLMIIKETAVGRYQAMY